MKKPFMTNLLSQIFSFFIVFLIKVLSSFSQIRQKAGLTRLMFTWYQLNHLL